MALENETKIYCQKGKFEVAFGNNEPIDEQIEVVKDLIYYVCEARHLNPNAEPDKDSWPCYPECQARKLVEGKLK